MSSDYRRHLFYLLFVTALVLAAGVGLRDPWPADEPRFALIAKDMVETGNWLFPHVGGVIYPDKPPLFFWLVAVLYAITDSIRVAILLPGVLAGLGSMLLVTDLARRLWGPTTAIWCGATLLATFQFPLQMKTGQIDGLLCFWTTLGIYGFGRHLLAGPDWRWYTIGGLAAGLGVITKGVGFLPYLVFIPYAFAARRGWADAALAGRNWRWLLAPAATLLAIAAWFVPMMLAAQAGTNPELIAYRDNILVHQTVTRYADSWGHIRPIWYLFTNAASWLWLPATLCLPWLVPLWRQDLKTRNLPILLLLSWVLLVLVFFSLSDGKRSLYIFPAAPALALAAGFHARELIGRVGIQRILVGMPAVLGMMLVAVGMYALMNPHEVEEWAPEAIVVFKTSAALLVVGLLMIGTVVICRRRRVLIGFSVALAIFWVGASTLVAPSLDAVRSGSELIGNVEQQLAPGTEMGFVGWPEQFLFQWDKPVTHFGYRRHDQEAETADAVRWLMASPDRRILLPQSWLAPCFDQDAVAAMGTAHRRNWAVAGASSVLPVCGADAAEEPELVVQYHHRRIPGQFPSNSQSAR